MGDLSTENMSGAPLMCAVIVGLAVLVLIGFSFGFRGQVQF